MVSLNAITGALKSFGQGVATGIRNKLCVPYAAPVQILQKTERNEHSGECRKVAISTGEVDIKWQFKIGKIFDGVNFRLLNDKQTANAYARPFSWTAHRISS